MWLPDSYQVNDDKRRIPDRTPSRRECGLPDDAFVFCCFNNPFKITPEIFDIWMRLLKSTEDSVLWLFAGNSSSQGEVCRDNLRREAEKRGVASHRLIFAGKTNLADHLARHRLADLFLDTLPYNAHTTASDALWAGLPVVTCLGATFAGRVAASLLKAAGLSELVAASLEDYEALALKLARERSYLAAVKDKLVRGRDTCPLFDTERFTRNIEDAYLGMWQAYREGRPPASFAVAARRESQSPNGRVTRTARPWTGIAMSNEAFQGALSALQAGNIKDAERLFKEVLRTQPKHLGALNLLGIVLTRLARFAEAETYLQLALQENANSDATLYNYGLVLKALDRPTEALERFTQALAINPAAAETWNNRGTVFNDLKRHEEAIKDFDKAIDLQPRYAEAVCNKGNALATLRRLDDALSAFVRAADLKPDLVEAWLGRGEVLTELQNYDGALTAYDRALALKPNSAEAWLGRGNACARHTMHQDALTAYDSALALKADLAEAWLGRGNVLSNIGQYDEAFAAYDNALAFNPDLAAAWLGRGNVFADLARYDDAFAAYDRALALQPDLPEAWFSRGNVYTRLQRYDVAYTSYDTALKLNPDLAYAVGPRLNAKLYMSDWPNLESDILQFLTLIRDDQPTGVPFVTLAIPSSPADQLQCAKRYVRDQPAVSRHFDAVKPIRTIAFALPISRTISMRVR